MKQTVGADKAASRFVAITDPGSSLEKDARAEGFRHIYPGVKSIGGRYSALSNFGLVPAAVMGLDVERLLDHAAEMLNACAPTVPAAGNPGLVLGTILGVAANRGVDKLTIVASPDIYDLGAWLEQLIAESTGKDGKGIIPVDREALGPPEVYGDDRLFAYLRLEDAPDAAQDTAIAALRQAGRPVVTIRVATKYALSEEIIRWEIATAIAGAVMGINPFNQPDVEASKIATRSLTNEYEKTGTLPAEAPFLEGEGVKLFADPANVESLERAAGTTRTLVVVSQGAPRSTPSGRLLRAARVPRHERRARGRAAAHPPPRARSAARGHVPRLRTALSPLDRPGLQRRPEHRRLSADHVRRCP